MSLGVKLSTFAAALIFAGSAVADPTCPSLSDIQKVGIQMAHQVNPNSYIGYSVNQYNTRSYWGFAIGLVDANSDEEAIDVTNEILTTLSSEGVPDTSSGQFACMYDTGRSDLVAVAVKARGASPLIFKQYMH